MHSQLVSRKPLELWPQEVIASAAAQIKIEANGSIKQ